MLIVHIEPPSLSLQGDQVYRTVQPCQALAELPDVFVISGSWLSAAVRHAARTCDILVLCQAVDADMLVVCLERQRNRLVTIFEINDDFTATPAYQAAATFSQNPVMLGLTLQLAQLCDARQFSSVALQKRFAELGGPSAVFANHLAALADVPIKRADRVNLGYGASPGHLEDAQALAKPLKRVLQRFAGAHFVTMVHPEVRQVFAALPAHRCDHFETGDLQTYQRFLARVHIGLAPLLPTAFNLGRSDVKYLEYTNAGAASVCSNLSPYHRIEHGRHGFLCDRIEDFEEGCLQLLHAPSRRTEYVAAARDQVGDSRLEAQHAAARLAFLQAPLRRPPRGSPKSFAAAVAAHQGAVDVRTPRYAQLLLGEAERSLLVVMQHRGPAEAAVQAAPQHHLAHLYAGQRHTEADAALASLQRAASLQPESLAVLHAFGKRLHTLGQMRAALAAYNRALALAPCWAPGHEALGLVRLAQGESQAARRNFSQALRVNPYYRPPALRLAYLAAQAGDRQEACSLLKRTVQMGLASSHEAQLLQDLSAG